MREQPWQQVWSKCSAAVTWEQREGMEADITIEEIEGAAADLPKRKAAGPDGMPMDHLHAVMPTVCLMLGEMFNAFLSGRQRMPTGFGGATIVVLHKKGDPAEIRNWRPVSLLSAPYKLYAKVLANRLARVLPSLIHPTQTGFVRGRQILTNVIMIREVLHTAAQVNPPLAVMLLDFEKAYNKVRWSFLLHGLEMWGFGERFCKLMASDHVRSTSQGPFVRAVHCHRRYDTAAISEVTQSSVTALKEKVQQFEHYTGARVNWAKSAVIAPEVAGEQCFQGLEARGVRKVTTGITGLWKPSVHSDVAFLSFDVGSSYHCEAEFTKCWIVHPPAGNVSWA
ncbi:hypothetical protein CBR_g24019 [Chara braunii]|uniref:Reverse transcriptase domain-containing protein n=1 Tax=Chara braunii TaxID=69332 RepID=A0A388L5Q4_CHABU|nr:hypothetical protein CBR_g24019 [Chara braunii]|eukprot:GBG77572.1 hypothetical protein CBR_g24019 [Chara braunii]